MLMCKFKFVTILLRDYTVKNDLFVLINSHVSMSESKKIRVVRKFPTRRQLGKYHYQYHDGKRLCDVDDIYLEMKEKDYMKLLEERRIEHEKEYKQWGEDLDRFMGY